MGSDPPYSAPASDEAPVDQATSRRSSSGARRRRRWLPRFGLRTLLVVAVLFCLCFAWIGKRYYELRQDEAAIEALK